MSRIIYLCHIRIRKPGGHCFVRHALPLLFAAGISNLLMAPSSHAQDAFTGEFDPGSWSLECISEFQFGCGTFLLDNTTLVVRSPDPVESETNLYRTLFTNSAVRQFDYFIKFDATFSSELDPENGPIYGIYAIGSQQLPPITNMYSEKGIVLPKDSQLVFGVYNENLFADATNPLQATLTITNFSATPVTAPVVPAPLPAIGAGSLFLGSRRLKRRIFRQRVLRLARRNLAPAIRSVLPG